MLKYFRNGVFSMSPTSLVDRTLFLVKDQKQIFDEYAHGHGASPDDRAILARSIVSFPFLGEAGPDSFQLLGREAQFDTGIESTVAAVSSRTLKFVKSTYFEAIKPLPVFFHSSS